MGSINLGATRFGAASFGLILIAKLIGIDPALAGDPVANACPVDGCEVRIIEVKRAGNELALKFDANFKPDVSKNHLHVWWGEQFDVKQVGRNAKTFGVEKGKWHRHDDYPSYTTTGAASTSIRNGAVTICVTAADRDHFVLDPGLFHCVDAGSHL